MPLYFLVLWSFERMGKCCRKDKQQLNFEIEVIRTALRLLEAEELKIRDFNKALCQGEKSGLEKNFDPKANLKKLHSRFL